MEDQERGFEVIDRRGVRSAPSAEEIRAKAEDSPFGPFGPSIEEMAGGDADLAEEGDDPVGDMDMLAVLRMTVGLLNHKTWVELGLIANPRTGSVRQRLDEARRAIDVIADLVKHLEPLVETAEKRDLQVMLSNLRMNFVRQSTTAAAGPQSGNDS